MPTGPHLWQIQWVRDLVLIAVAVFLVWFGYFLRGIFTPVLIALFLAYLFDPLITWAERRKVARPLSISALIFGLVIVAAGLIAWLGPIAARETGQFVENVPGYAGSLATRLEERFNIDAEAVVRTIDERIATIRENPGEHVAKVLRWLVAGGDTLMGVVSGVVGTITFVGFMALLIPFYFFFFAWRFGPMVRSLRGYIPEHERDRVLHVVGRMDKVVSCYFRERVLICLIMAVLFSVGWWLCGVPYALLLGLAAGLLSLIPYVGIVVWPVAMLMAYLNATSGADAPGFAWMSVVVWPSVVYGVVQFLEGWILTPVIQGKSMEMSSVTILLVVFIGGTVGGLYGMILCIPVAACIKILCAEVVLPRMKAWAAAN